LEIGSEYSDLIDLKTYDIRIEMADVRYKFFLSTVLFLHNGLGFSALAMPIFVDYLVRN